MNVRLSGWEVLLDSNYEEVLILGELFLLMRMWDGYLLCFFFVVKINDNLDIVSGDIV